MRKKQRYDINFECRKSLGNYDRMVIVDQRDLTWGQVKRIVREYHQIGKGLQSDGRYIRGTVTVISHNDTVMDNIVHFEPCDIVVSKDFNSLISLKEK